MGATGSTDDRFDGRKPRKVAQASGPDRPNPTGVAGEGTGARLAALNDRRPRVQRATRPGTSSTTRAASAFTTRTNSMAA